MSILKWFNKPKWQNPNQQVRLTAVQNSTDPDLMSALPLIAESDQSPEVRNAALARIEDTDQLLQIAQQNNPETGKIAYRKLAQIIAQSEVDDEQLKQIIRQIKGKQSLKIIATDAKVANFRKAAVEQIEQQGFLGDLLLKEKDKTVQNAIIEKLTQQSTLQRIAKQLSKKNKQLYKKISQKIDRDQSPNYQQQALEICQQLEAVVHQQKTADLQKIEHQWQQLVTHIDQKLQQRYTGALSAAKMTLDPQHRQNFLQQQRQIRAKKQLQELQKLCQNGHKHKLQQLQQQLEQHTTIELELLDQQEKQQHQHSIQQLQQIISDQHQRQQLPEAVTEIIQKLQKTLSREVVQPHLLKQFRTNWQQATNQAPDSKELKKQTAKFEQSMQKLAEKVEKTAKQRDVAAQQVIDLIEPTTRQIKDGHLAQAKISTNKIAALKQTAGHNHPLLRRHKYQIDNLWVQLKELRQWQKWSNDKIRQDIIQELSDLIGTATHPDAVLKKLKDCNERWYALENMEKLEGDRYPTRNQKQWQEFRTVSKALFEPAQPYFAKRSEHQQDRLTETELLIEQMQQIDLEQSSEKELAEITSKAIKKLKGLDQLPPKSRGKVAKKLRAGIDRVDSKLKDFYQQAEQQKQKIIDQAHRLTEEEDIEKAVEQAKQLQQQWREAGVVKQHTERKLWKKFRQANDLIFAKRDQLNEQKNAEQQAQKQQRKQLIDDFLNQLKQADEDGAIKALKQQLEQQWQQLPQDHKNNNQTLQQALKQADQKRQKILMKSTFEELDKLQQIDRQCSLENLDQEQQQAMLQSCPQAWQQQLAQRFEQTADEQILNQHLIKSEFLSGLDTPKDQLQQRMELQVEILSQRMAGEKNNGESQQAIQLLGEWYCLPKTLEYLETHKQRIANNIKALQKLI